MNRFLVIGIALITGCANQTTPTGGERDTTAPVLIRSSPENNQKNFLGFDIELTFDEMVKLYNPKEEILIVPSPGKNNLFKTKNNRIFISPETPWAENTTYSISFREGIKDLNESNPVENLKIAFSTGAYIDSLSISGFVQNALVDKIPTNITVALYQLDTFNIFKHTPDYFTKTEANGAFKLENLKPGKYHIYAFNDINKNLIVESKTEAYGFKADQINLETNSDSLTLRIMILDSREPKINNIRNLGKLTKIKFNKYVNSYSFKSLYENISSCFGNDQTEIDLYLSQDPSPDSVLVSLHVLDSLSFKIDTTFYISQRISNYIADDFSYNFSKGQLSGNNFSTNAIYNKPISKITFDSLYVMQDTLYTIPLSPLDIRIDTIGKRIFIDKKIDPVYPSNKLKIEFVIAKGAFQSIDQDTSKAQLVSISELTPESTGTVIIENITTEKSFMVQLLDSRDNIVQSMKDIKKYMFKNILPGEYKLRVLIDTSNNGTWDYGNIFNNTEPEPIHYYKNPEGASQFPVRANWELGPLIFNF